MKRIAFAFMTAVALLLFISPPAQAFGFDSLLMINEPRDNFMTTADKIVVSGETLPETRVTVLVNGSSKAKFSVGAAGIFLTQVPVASKDNIITIKAVFPTGGFETVSRRVYQMDSESEWSELDSLIQTIKTFLILK